MIQFFRKIRQKILSEGKTGTYIKYGLGEIVLVVIGILIAIQLNQWRQDSNNAREKQVLLKSLKSEFDANILQLDTVLYYNAKVLSAYHEAIHLLNNDINKAQDEYLKVLLRDLSWQWTFNPINGALNSGISSGKIHLIQSSQLKEMLFSWEGLVIDAAEEAVKMRHNQVSSREYKQDYINITDLFAERNPYIGLIKSNFNADYKGMIKDPRFIDYAGYSFMWASGYTNELEHIKHLTLEILELIHSELAE